MSPSVNLSPHKQQVPRDVTFHEHAGEVLVSYVSENVSAWIYEVLGETRNPRTLVRCDKALVGGTLVEAIYQEDLKRIRTCHPVAGLMHKFDPDEWLDTPALRLSRLEYVSTETTE